MGVQNWYSCEQGSLDPAKLSVHDLRDGQLLCALLISASSPGSRPCSLQAIDDLAKVRPDVLPKAIQSKLQRSIVGYLCSAALDMWQANPVALGRVAQFLKDRAASGLFVPAAPRFGSLRLARPWA